MYNNIGLRTARGSGTNGHIQANRSAVNPYRERETTAWNSGQKWKEVDGAALPTLRKADEAILEHERKRKAEVKLFELRCQLEDDGADDATVEGKVAEARARMAAAGGGRGGGGGGGGGSHEQAVAKSEADRRVRRAFGLDDDWEVRAAAAAPSITRATTRLLLLPLLLLTN